jgi:manganese/zinc/iron transport system substrate-binding protein
MKLGRIGVALIAGLALAPLAAGCGGGGGDAGAPSGPVRVTTTIGMIADVARVVGGDRVAVTALMGPGVDPHLYKASEGDLRRLDDARLILYNGLHLEGKMSDLLVRMSRTRPVIAVTEGIPESLLREPPEMQGQYDPHVWFDVSLWRRAVERVRDALIEVDPGGRAGFEARAAAYLDSLDALHAWCATRWPRCRPSAACWSPRTTRSATSGAPTPPRSSGCRASARWPSSASPTCGGWWT